MKQWLCAIGIVLPIWSSAQDEKIVCRENGTQLELNQCAADEYTRTDNELNQVWKQIQLKYADQSLFLKKLKAAQLLWLQFRDAEMEAKFPVDKQENPRFQYGSVYPMCWAGYKAALTSARVRDLKVWLTGEQEGDVCMGSVKLSDELSKIK
ncbi:MAG: DUF1311 domain-containing protein [Proteobacteria bacterium]|uniref:lysozyme inhibitor LprI family protein n=1 Tax=Rudaea sp. TaxID=2136325 RepID=UPI00321F9EF8|nr:DUF1311 domain-containing protein [Pseudomonadota bacterium]